MNPSDTTATKYLNEFRSALQRYRVPLPEEILSDLRNHISEATGSGKSVTDVVAALGAPNLLARAYAMELLINPPQDSKVTAAVRMLKIFGLVLAGGFFSLFIAAILAILGFSLVVAGPAMVVGGVLQSMGMHPWWISTGNMAPLTIISIGVIGFICGCGICWILWRYVLMTARTLRKVLPPVRF